MAILIIALSHVACRSEILSASPAMTLCRSASTAVLLRFLSAFGLISAACADHARSTVRDTNPSHAGQDAGQVESDASHAAGSDLDARVQPAIDSGVVSDAGASAPSDADAEAVDGGKASDAGSDASAGEAPLLAPVPPMGWNSWNKFGCGKINEQLIRDIADALVSSGLASAGYATLTVDDCWSAKTRTDAGELTADALKFPSGMKALADYVHGRGLRFGIYASIGTATCTGKTPGSLDQEARDVATFASWGVDYIKADRCNADGLNMHEIYARWRRALDASPRPMVLSASDNGGKEEPWSWGPVTAQQWRTTSDIRDNWTRMMQMFDGNSKHAAATAPGSFNDPDMLEVGNGGMSEEEYRTHQGLWALMSAPLIAGHDVRTTTDAAKAILTHPEVLDVDQDALAFQAIMSRDDGAGRQVWYKPIAASGGRVVGLLNRGEAAADIALRWTDIGLSAGQASVRDLWQRVNRGSFADGYHVQVPAHGLALLRVMGSEPALESGPLSDQTWTYSANEWGPVERNLSNGERSAGDGKPLTLAGVTYAKGLGVNAPAAVEFRPDGKCSSFSAQIGIDDEQGNAGSVIFQVWSDGRKLFDSGVLTGASSTQKVRLDIQGRREIRLQVVAVDDSTHDHADWADAQIVCP
jgi:alpha-galactosidase